MRLALPTLLLAACAVLAAPARAPAQGMLVADPAILQAAAHQDSLVRGTSFLINRGAPVRTVQLDDGTFDQHAAEDLGAGEVLADEPDLNTQFSPSNDTLPGDWIGPNPAQPGVPLTAGEEEPQHSHWLISWLGIDYWGAPLEEGPRFTGPGRPLLRGSWMNRPWSLSWYFGGMFAQGLVPNEVNQGSGGFGGVRLGWDFDYYMGAEMRVGQAKPSIDYPVPSVRVRRQQPGRRLGHQLPLLPVGRRQVAALRPVWLGRGAVRLSRPRRPPLQPTAVWPSLGCGHEVSLGRPAGDSAWSCSTTWPLARRAA